ncbi:hypothetical protein HZ326_9384 [Fusarium oxysporum f. sp. albedinis]|nr:hypothetical protein HZ326_9384 [Fusarium oxysporum f. sp. albedinis]
MVLFKGWTPKVPTERTSHSITAQSGQSHPWLSLLALVPIVFSPQRNRRQILVDKHWSQDRSKTGVVWRNGKRKSLSLKRRAHKNFIDLP